MLVPVAFLRFLATLVFGFLIGDVRLPRRGHGALMLYWLYPGPMSLFMTLPHHDRNR